MISADEWMSPDGAVGLLAWSNEPEHKLLPAPLRKDHGRAIGHCGYLRDSIAVEEDLRTAADLGPVTAGLGGCFSVFRADRERLEAATSITRVCPVYYARAGSVAVVGSRALLVHLVARAVETGLPAPEPDIDVLALQPMVRHGFFTNDETPFRGVRALPNAAVLSCGRDGSMRVVRRPFPVPEPAPRTAAAATARVERLADALLAAAQPLALHDEPVRLGLSGGRDSRLMAAVLHAAGVPVHARTHGFADDPDVILATRIARALGVEHDVEFSGETERPDAITVEHPLSRARRVIRLCEGMTSAYERVGGYAPYVMEPRTSGSGGETLRGGFLYDQEDVSPDGLRRRVRSVFLSGEKFLTAAANERARTLHESWTDQAGPDGFDALDKLYLFYRTGRWIVGSHTATLMNSPYYHPFLDNQVVREALMLPAEWRHSEEVVFRLIETLAPRLAAVPPEGKPWRFDRGRPPLRPAGLRAWYRRRPVAARGGSSGFNWRSSFDENFLSLLREQLSSAPRELFDVVDESQARRLFSRVPRGWVNQVWHIFTLGVLLSGDWRRSPTALPPVTIPIRR
ncbi:MAG TPA: asparagine synthase-related protein [Streptosporangiaceae bacterium]|nr:asparagine synthase-related protein [Streptosporangiaceae bacterium]